MDKGVIWNSIDMFLSDGGTWTVDYFIECKIGICGNQLYRYKWYGIQYRVSAAQSFRSRGMGHYRDALLAPDTWNPIKQI